MKKAILLFLIIFTLLGAGKLHSQVAATTFEFFKSSKADTNLLLQIRDTAFAYWGEANAEDIVELAKIGIEKSKELENIEKEVDFHLYAGTHSDILGNWKEAESYFTKGIQLSLSEGNLARAGDFELNQGVSYYFRGLQDSALHHYLQANSYYQSGGEKGKLSKVYNNLAIIYKGKGDFKNALDIYNKSIDIKTELSDTAGLANSYQNRGILLSKTGENEAAIADCLKALSFHQQIGSEEDIADCYSSLGYIYLEMGSTKKAFDALEQAVSYFEKNPSSPYAPISLTNFGQLLLATENFERAISYLELAEEYAREKDMKETLLSNYRLQAEAYQKIGNSSKAYDLLEKGFIIKDTLTKEDRIQAIEELQVKFDMAQKEADLKISNLQLAQRTNQRNWILAAIVLLLSAGMALYFGLSNKLKATKKIAAAEAALHEQKLVQLEQEKTLQNIKAVVEAEEKERSRIAGELHDSIGGLLTTIKAHFNELPQPATTKSLHNKTGDLIDEACVEVRRISHNMMPRVLTVMGLKGAIEDLAGHIAANGIETQLEIIGLDDNTINIKKVMLFRILQELSQNLLKHAEAKSVFIQVMEHSRGLNVVFEDDGKGFHVENAKQKRSIGLKSLENRVRFLEGDLVIDSVPAQGTTFSINISNWP